MARLKKSEREDILRALLVKRFRDQVDALLLESRNFVGQVVCDLFGDRLELARSLPPGWLCRQHGFLVQFAGEVCYLNSDGGLYSGPPRNLVVLGSELESSPQFLLANFMTSGVVKTYESGEPLAEEWCVLRNRQTELATEVAAAERQVRAVLESCPSHAHLRKTWPEVWDIVVPLLGRGEARPPLPAVQIDELNQLFGLPGGRLDPSERGGSGPPPDLQPN